MGEGGFTREGVWMVWEVMERQTNLKFEPTRSLKMIRVALDSLIL
jgi:hypothetical protein